MRINTFSLKKSNILFSIFTAIGLHYLLNPSESISSPLIATLVRLISATIILSVIFFIERPKKNSARLAYVFSAICIWFILNNFPENTLMLFLLFLFLGFGFLISAYLISESDSEIGIVARGLDLVLIFWISSLFLQLLIYAITSDIVDFHQWFHPLSEARISGAGLFIRFTGALIEPGTYANWVYGLVLLRGLARGNLFDRLSVLSMVSILLTLSAWGVLAVVAYMVSYIGRYIISNEIKMYHRRSVAAVILLILCAITYFHFSKEIGEAFKYLSDRSELADGSGVAKIEAYQGFLNFFIRIFIFGLPVNFDFCKGCLSPQDAGIFINLAVRGGLVFAVVVFFVIVKSTFKRYGAIACLSLLPLLFAKYFYFEPLFWALFGFSFLNVYQLKPMRKQSLQPNGYTPPITGASGNRLFQVANRRPS